MAVQIVSQFFYGASSIVLKGYSSTAQNIVAVFRNFAAMNYVGTLSCTVIAVTTAVSLIKEKNDIPGAETK